MTTELTERDRLLDRIAALEQQLAELHESKEILATSHNVLVRKYNDMEQQLAEAKAQISIQRDMAVRPLHDDIRERDSCTARGWEEQPTTKLHIDNIERVCLKKMQEDQNYLVGVLQQILTQLEDIKVVEGAYCGLASHYPQYLEAIRVVEEALARFRYPTSVEDE